MSTEDNSIIDIAYKVLNSLFIDYAVILLIIIIKEQTSHSYNIHVLINWCYINMGIISWFS